MPTMLSANLNAATLMIGAKAADMVLGRQALEPVMVPEQYFSRNVNEFLRVTT